MNHTDLDWSKAHQENAELMQQLREKEARIARLAQAIKEIAEPEYYETEYDGQMLSVCNLCGSLEEFGHEPDCGEEYRELLNETPQQSLAHIQADAIERFCNWLDENEILSHEFTEEFRERYAQQLRDKANEKL